MLNAVYKLWSAASGWTWSWTRAVFSFLCFFLLLFIAPFGGNDTTHIPCLFLRVCLNDKLLVMSVGVIFALIYCTRFAHYVVDSL